MSEKMSNLDDALVENVFVDEENDASATLDSNQMKNGDKTASIEGIENMCPKEDEEARDENLEDVSDNETPALDELNLTSNFSGDELLYGECTAALVVSDKSEVPRIGEEIVNNCDKKSEPLEDRDDLVDYDLDIDTNQEDIFNLKFLLKKKKNGNQNYKNAEKDSILLFGVLHVDFLLFLSFFDES